MSLFQYEHRSRPVASRRTFLGRLGRHLLVAVGIIAVAMLVGIAGYILIEGRGVIDAYDHAAMILSGMGPFEQAKTDLGRVFEGTYALVSGLLIVVISGIVLAPVLHRVLHRLHADDKDS